MIEITKRQLTEALLESKLIARYQHYAFAAYPETMGFENEHALASEWAGCIIHEIAKAQREAKKAKSK